MGRKSFKEELQLFHRYAELSEPYFKVLREHFESPKKDDQRWAAERIEKAYVKMIPQEIAGDVDNPLTLQVTGMQIIKDQTGGTPIQNQESEATTGG